MTLPVIGQMAEKNCAQGLNLDKVNTETTKVKNAGNPASVLVSGCVLPLTNVSLRPCASTSPDWRKGFASPCGDGPSQLSAGNKSNITNH